MKRNLRFVLLSGVVLLAFSIILVSCKKDEEDKNTIIKGTAYFPAGTSGDLSNAKVSIYTSYDNWVFNQPIKFTSVAGGGASVEFEMKDVLPGNYYLDVWKDIDNSATWTVSDFVGWYGSGGLGSPDLTEFQITDGQTLDFDIPMYILVKKGPGFPK
jgi:uncharacterized protein (DUF2141 family)